MIIGVYKPSRLVSEHEIGSLKTQIEPNSQASLIKLKLARKHEPIIKKL